MFRPLTPSLPLPPSGAWKFLGKVFARYDGRGDYYPAVVQEARGALLYDDSNCLSLPNRVQGNRMLSLEVPRRCKATLSPPGGFVRSVFGVLGYVR